MHAFVHIYVEIFQCVLNVQDVMSVCFQICKKKNKKKPDNYNSILIIRIINISSVDNCLHLQGALNRSYCRGFGRVMHPLEGAAQKEMSIKQASQPAKLY